MYCLTSPQIIPVKIVTNIPWCLAGAGIDSYFEYLVKAAGLLQRPELMAIFKQAWAAIEKHLRHEDWYLWATMTKGYVTMAVFQSLEAYWPGVLTLVGALATVYQYLFQCCSFASFCYSHHIYFFCFWQWNTCSSCIVSSLKTFY